MPWATTPSSASQPDWLFIAHQPPGDHPRGAYFTTLEPSAPNLAISAASATASYQGQTISLLPAQGGFWAVIGAAADATTGQFPISIVLRDANGAVIGEMSETLAVYDADFPIEYITLPPDQSGLLGADVGAQEESLRQQMFATSSAERLWAGTFAYPVQGSAISSPYGQQRSYNGGPISGFHHGADFGVDEGTGVYASAAGRVAFVGAMPIRGNSVVIDHGGGRV